MADVKLLNIMLFCKQEQNNLGKQNMVKDILFKVRELIYVIVGGILVMILLIVTMFDKSKNH